MAASCVPNPHYEYEIPKIATCVVNAEAHPLRDVRVELDLQGAGPIWRGETDHEGRFLFLGKKKFQLFRYIEMGDEFIGVYVNIYKDSALVFSDLYDVAGPARTNELDKNLAVLPEKNPLVEHLSGSVEPECIVVE